MELILDAARLLLEALSKNEIQIQQLADQKIGQTVNLIRKNNKEIAPGIYKIYMNFIYAGKYSAS